MKSVKFLMTLATLSLLSLQASQASNSPMVEHIDGRSITTPTTGTGNVLQAGASLPGPGGHDSKIDELCNACIRNLASVPTLDGPRFLKHSSPASSGPQTSPASTDRAQ